MSVFVIGSELQFSGNVSHVPPTSRHVIARDQAFPGLVLQMTNAQLRRLGYEASRKVDTYIGIAFGIKWCEMSRREWVSPDPAP